MVRRKKSNKDIPGYENRGRKNAAGKTTGVAKVWSDEEIIQALEEHDGIIHAAAVHLGCATMTIYNRSKQTPAIKAVIKRSRRNLCDLAEAGLRYHLTNKESGDNFRAVSFTLSTLGKNRGYVKRVEQRVGGDANAPPIRTENMWDLVPIELKKQVLAAIRAKKGEPPDEQVNPE